MEDVVCDCGECLMCWLEEQGSRTAECRVWASKVMALTKEETPRDILRYLLRVRVDGGFSAN